MGKSEEQHAYSTQIACAVYSCIHNKMAMCSKDRILVTNEVCQSFTSNKVQARNQEQFWRRFIPISDNIGEFQKLCKMKNLSNEDLLLILKSVKINPSFT